MKVLIIDDSPDAIAMVKARLAKEQLEIICAASGQAGLDAARLERPDLVLLDIKMPEMDGYDVCRALKADAELCMIPIIFLTGSVTTEDKVKGLDLGAVDYISKPFDGFELRARVRAALRNKHMQDLLIKYAQIDPLTELSNRRALTERLQHEWARVQRHGGSLAFIMADIDRFKRVNDKHAHRVGDQMLCEVAKILVNLCRESDLPARYGGEEFAIICPDVDAESAAQLAERCRQGIADIHVQAENDEVQVTASFGVADAAGASSSDTLIEAADEALYLAKQSGRNCVAVADQPAKASTTE